MANSDLLSTKLVHLQAKLAYSFNDIELLKLALTHSSVGTQNNERLEFIGDGLVNLIIGHELFQRYPDAKEGKLSRLRAILVSGEALAELARELTLPDYLFLGAGELKTGGRARDSILADALEALIGAVFLDSDFNTCQKIALTWYQHKLSDPHLSDYIVDAKTALQELLQAQKASLPVYTMIEQSGQAHDRFFRVSCQVEHIAQVTEGEGSTRRKAEQQAARKMLEQLS